MAESGNATLEAILKAARRSSASEEIGALMDSLTPDLIGLPRADAPSSQRERGVIYTRTLHEDAEMELVVFIFPDGATLPLHNHPGMTVYSKVLYGSLAVRALDWERPLRADELELMSQETEALLAADAEQQQRGRAGARTPLIPSLRARRRADAVLTPSTPTARLTPSSGNVHAFAAHDCG